METTLVKNSCERINKYSLILRVGLLLLTTNTKWGLNNKFKEANHSQAMTPNAQLVGKLKRRRAFPIIKRGKNITHLNYLSLRIISKRKCLHKTLMIGKNTWIITKQGKFMKIKSILSEKRPESWKILQFKERGGLNKEGGRKVWKRIKKSMGS